MLVMGYNLFVALLLLNLCASSSSDGGDLDCVMGARECGVTDVPVPPEE